ncbi:MAG: hypothetical protein AAF586_01270 [Planctomycetota bacterium]
MKRYLDAILAEMKADKRKAIALSAVLALGLLLWGRLLIKNEVPRVATATPEAVLPAPTPTTPAPTAIEAGPRPDIEVYIPNTNPRNLFGFDPSPYRPTLDGEVGQGPSKLPAASTDDPDQTQRVVQQARQLSLQSVVVNGGTRQALIDGQLVGAGQRIDGFEVVSVQERNVVLRKNGVLVRLGL